MIKHVAMNTMKKAMLCIVCACLAFSAASFCLRADAASYDGRGSKSDPYLIYTAEQLDGIRDNLSAHYKLANTIDLSGIADFKPIGSLKTPFKGSLSCDLDKDGKPLYAIKGLKMKVSPKGSTKAEGFSGYKKDGSSGWEAGLFGCADGASFANILVLDASVTSTVEGLYQMNSDFSVNPGVDDMAAGILVAIGKGITVKGCGVSGTLTSASNHVGGMLGSIQDSNVSASWSVATVTSTGSWGAGGFVGTAKGTVGISECFYNGTFSGGLTHAGAFGGSVYGDKITIKDCWAAGTVKTKSSGCFIGTKNHTDDNTLRNVDISSQCYTVSKIEGRTQKPTSKKLVNANYAAQEAGVLEVGFCAATQDEINTAFKSFSAWTVEDGSYPQLKNVKMAAAADYKPLSNPPAPTTVPGNPDSEATVPADEPQDTQPGAADTSTDAAEPGKTEETGTAAETEAPGDTTSATQGTTGDEAMPAGDDLLVMSRTSEILLVVTLSVLAAAALAGSVVTLVFIVKKRSGKR